MSIAVHLLPLPPLVVCGVRDTHESVPAALCILSRRGESMIITPKKEKGVEFRSFYIFSITFPQQRGMTSPALTSKVLWQIGQ